MSEQDERLAGLYRRISIEDPPPYLDARIAEAARLEPGRRVPQKRRDWWILWRVPFAVAAVAVVSVSLVSLMMEQGAGELTSTPRESELRSPAVDAAPAPPSQPQPEALPQTNQQTLARSPQAAASAYDTAEAAAERRAPAREPVTGRDRPAALPAVVPAPETPPATPPTAMRDAATISEKAAVRAEIGAAAGARDLQKEQAQAMSAPAQAPAPLQSRAASPAPAASAVRAFKRADSVESEAAGVSAVSRLFVELSGRPPAEWIERIATLRREGRRAEANALLEEFRRRYPDQPIPPELGEK